MHDDIPLTIGRARRVLDERILPAVHATAVPLTVEWNELPGEPITPAEGLALAYRPYEVGTPWGAAWGTTWFHVTGTVPEQWAGRRVEARIDLGFDVNMPGFQCEGLVYRPDGSPVKSINPRNQWVLVTEQAEGGELVDLYLEGASNPVLLDYHPFLPTQEGDIQTSSSRRLYTSRRMDLTVFEAEVHELALDIEVLLELQAELPQGPRRMRILQALDDALDALDLQHIPETAPDARAALADVLASPAEASAHRISAVGHAHIDSAWLWPVRETIRKVARTTSSMTELIDQTDDFVYGMSSAQQYAWIKEHRPEVYARVKEAVAAGRFLPLGGMWVESDTVMPTGESIVRQFSQGQRFFEREFGIRPKGVWLPDSFGYSPALPQLMRRAGFEWFFTQKISWNQVNKFPHHTFLWEGIDGSRVFSHFPSMDTYNSQLSGSEVAKASRQFRENRLASGSIAPVGWGDGGGGTTREMTGKAARLADLEGSAQVAWEHPDAFFERARGELANPPVWVGELYLELHRATLTSQHGTKQGNRRAEHLLIEAELWCATAAARTGFAYPYDELDALWQQVLLQQFHDILPGTSIAWVHREAVEQYARVADALVAIIAQAVRALVGEGDTPVLVNPAPFARGGAPALGAVVAASVPQVAPVTITEDGDAHVLENDLVRITVSAEGLVTSAVDLGSGRDAIAPGQAGNLLQLHQDFPNMWDAWDVDRYYRNRVEDIRGVDELTVSTGADGVARIVVRRSFSESSIEQTLSLAPGSRTLEVAQVVDWHETEKFLKVAFPLDVRAEHTIAETQFGANKRVTHSNTSWEAAKFETSMHRYVLAEEPGFGVALVNDSIHGYDMTRDAVDGDVTTTLRLSLLRAPRFPDPETDQGVQTHRFGLVVGTSVAGATEEGVLLNVDARTVTGDHGFDPLVTVSDDLVLSSVKLADDRSGDLVVRVYEPAGRRARGTVTVAADVAAVTEVTLLEEAIVDAATTGASSTVAATDPATVDLALGGFEVRTLRFTLG
ncbi:glycoside hydrolase family 38 C-terminal domain-containing protein [Curtobacterium sp. MCBD17_019]|uniref:alpha-mannosidase n=1 Tax=Curtobacterium sp. MCBD17_019 TaxID=2175669 RepID=UPI000DA75B8E|nr:glycoside hydrolase family 38 C-terminal domain-containing protein [Curtobacterium sp. MCBD17_019]PZE74768.1 alpha-mannosidase [Curtobacterium sp. MCBD17_019]